MKDELSLLGALKHALKMTLELDEQESVKAALTTPKGKGGYGAARFYLSPEENNPIELRCGEGLEFSCSGLIADHNTATLAILQITRNGLDFARAIREVVSLRHAMLQPNDFVRQTFSVELVFVMDSDSPMALAELSEELQKHMTQTSYLHAIGINLLVCDSEKPGKSAVRRAFSWLLNDVWKWYQSPEFQQRFKNADGKKGKKPKLERLELENFRLCGKRTWEKSAEHQLHLIHGHNGTGKSTFTEAYELLITGKLDRLKGEDDYRPILRFREPTINGEQPEQSPTPAQIRVKYVRKKEVEEWFVGDQGLESEAEEPRAFSEVDSGSFRMEQGFADDLVRSGRGMQMGRFLSAFFPDEKEAVKEFWESREKFNQAWKNIDSRVQTKIVETTSIPDPELVLDTIEGCWNGEGVAIPDRMLKFSTISGLKRMLKNAQGIGLQFNSESATVSELDDAWESVKREAADLLHEIDALLPRLQEINQWNIQAELKAGTREELAGLINQWLEACVLCDLLQKEIDVLLVAKAVDEVPDLILGRLKNAKSSNIKSQKKNLKTQQQLRDDLRRQIAELSLGNATQKGSTERPKVSGSFYSSVNKYTTGAKENPGDVFQRALSRNSSSPLGFSFEGMSVTIGVEGGLSPLINSLVQKQEIASGIRSQDVEFSLQQLADDLTRLRDTALECRRVDDSNVAQFKSQLEGPLAGAFNELTALFTPARWAYQDIKADVNEENGATEFQMDGLPADLLLNTAELNTLALVLFFLCAPSNHNPVRLLLLDDPFQNMDELTVTKVARGLKRLLAIWGFDARLKEWEILILLHGEENLERMRRECESAVYFLEWLTPTAMSRQQDPDSERGAKILPDDDPRSEKREPPSISELIVDFS